MSTEEITGIEFPDRGSARNDSMRKKLLLDIADLCGTLLREGGYLSQKDGEAVASAYRERLEINANSTHSHTDFMAVLAEQQARQYGLRPEGEIARMQKILRWSLSDRVRCWTFGPLPGPSDALYCHSIVLREICGFLACPSMWSGEGGIVHVVSINPVSALVSVAWITQELMAETQGESPFVFPLMVDLPTWSTMFQRHFCEL